jgi:hypothetical protein
MWVNPKYKTEFTGFYERDESGERIFVLISLKGRRIAFESWQMAKSQGFKKV